MPNPTTNDATATPTDAVRIERSVDAPIELVWKLWTEAAHFATWYGPDGASVRVDDMDATEGGTRSFRMEMNTPNGPMQMWFTGEFREIDEPHRLVYTEAMCDEHGTVVSPAESGMPEGHPTETTVTVELSELDGRTAMVMTHAGVPADSPGATGWNMALDKLETYAASRTSS
jgi:uncharacterized protein YndB with AHSA1/START domain